MCLLNHRAVYKGWGGWREASPDPPRRDVALGEQEAAEQQEDKEEECTACGRHILIAAQAAVEAEQADAHVVQHGQQQDQGEEPAIYPRSISFDCPTKAVSRRSKTHGVQVPAEERRPQHTHSQAPLPDEVNRETWAMLSCLSGNATEEN